MIIDTHAHLNTKQFKDDLKEVVLRAKQADVLKVIIVGMDKEHNRKAIHIAQGNEGYYAAVGVHPCDIDHADVSDVIPLLKEKKVVSIGEIGIDLHWNKDNLEAQKKVFIEQLKLAVAYDLPVIIHTRESFNEAYACVLPFKGKIRGVFHCLTSDFQDALKVIELGMYVGIGGVVTFKNAAAVHQIAKNVPLESMLVETDAPFLAPHPHRGGRNEPAYTKLVVEKIAEIKKVSVSEVASKTSSNAIKLFRLEQVNEENI